MQEGIDRDDSLPAVVTFVEGKIHEVYMPSCSSRVLGGAFSY